MSRFILRQFVVVLFAINVAGCDPATRHAFEEEKKRSEDWLSGLQEAQGQAPIVQQFLSMFPAAKIRYTWFDGSKEPGFDGYVELHGRYELTMQLPVVFDVAGRHVVDYDEPKFYLLELTQRVGNSNNYVAQKVFGLAEWKKLVESQGDFSVIGWKMEKPLSPAVGEGEN